MLSSETCVPCNVSIKIPILTCGISALQDDLGFTVVNPGGRRLQSLIWDMDKNTTGDYECVWPKEMKLDTCIEPVPMVVKHFQQVIPLNPLLTICQSPGPNSSLMLSSSWVQLAECLNCTFVWHFLRAQIACDSDLTCRSFS
jgi:hypothetical protein